MSATSAVAETAALVFLKEVGLTFPHLLWELQSWQKDPFQGDVGILNPHYRTSVNTHPFFQALLVYGDQADAQVQKKVILGDKTWLLLFRSLGTFTNL